MENIHIFKIPEKHEALNSIKAAFPINTKFRYSPNNNERKFLINVSQNPKLQKIKNGCFIIINFYYEDGCNRICDQVFIPANLKAVDDFIAKHPIFKVQTEEELGFQKT